MKILLICSSLEPGHDGVGDYTRRLSGELIRNGHLVTIIALNDKHVFGLLMGFQDAEGVPVAVLRIPASYNSITRLTQAKIQLAKVNPDWVSLQYVSFGFHTYGLPWEMLLLRRQVIGQSKLHIMLHELWCGQGHVHLKERILGQVQKMFLERMLAVLKPTSVFTSIQSYAKQLKQLKVKSSVVPIFSNIAKDIWGDEAEWQKVVVACGLRSLYEDPSKWLVLGFFGTIYPQARIKDILLHASTVAQHSNRQLGVLVIGKNRGQEINSLVSEIPGAVCLHTGALPSVMINRALHLADLGVITSDADGLNKSGSAIAWLERGIPILLSEQDANYHQSSMSVQGIYQVTGPDIIELALNTTIVLSAKSRLAEVASAYLAIGN